LKITIEPAKRATAPDARRCRPLRGLLPTLGFVVLGLAPQALCYRSLRELKWV